MENNDSSSSPQTPKDKTRPRRKCQFNAELQKAYPTFNLMNPDNPHVVICKACLGIIDVSNSGRTSLEKHLKMRKHKDVIAASLGQVLQDGATYDDDPTFDNPENAPYLGEYVSADLLEDSQAGDNAVPEEPLLPKVRGPRPKRTRREAFSLPPSETTNTRIPTFHHQQVDQSAIFGELIAEQLRQLSPRKRILTQGSISNILQEALLEELDKDPPIHPKNSP